MNLTCMHCYNFLPDFEEIQLLEDNRMLVRYYCPICNTHQYKVYCIDLVDELEEYIFRAD